MKQALFGFLDATPTALHTACELVRVLSEHGFRRLDERERWDVRSGERYLLVRGASVVAWIQGQRAAAEAGFRIAVAHTDSPGLKLKHSAARNQDGYLVAPVEVYGSPIVSTWLDRDLTIAGSLTVAPQAAPQARDRAALRPAAVPFRLSGACAVIPNLAIHLNRTINDGFAYNMHDHLHAILGIAGNGESQSEPSMTVLQAVAGCAGVEADQVLLAELYLCDTQPAALTGLSGELLSASRLDNRAGCFTVCDALCNSGAGDATAMGVFFDHEEIGSRSWAGADSVLLRHAIERIVGATDGSTEARYRAAAASCIISNDAANALHPSYRDKHDRAYAPILGGGPVLKSDANQRYATVPELSALFAQLCRESGCTMQQLVSRADMRPGSTVGPFSAAQTGIAAIDVGIPLLAMHSMRETAALTDVTALRDVLLRYFR
ncbi:MAG: M18 family aminopeptidase [Spirochaetaceae bacterium]|nr:MAG: M18 family aminopeptidase [Spirochaetaceae bacterium]